MKPHTLSKYQSIAFQVQVYHSRISTISKELFKTYTQTDLDQIFHLIQKLEFILAQYDPTFPLNLQEPLRSQTEHNLRDINKITDAVLQFTRCLYFLP